MSWDCMSWDVSRVQPLMLDLQISLLCYSTHPLPPPNRNLLVSGGADERPPVEFRGGPGGALPARRQLPRGCTDRASGSQEAGDVLLERGGDAERGGRRLHRWSAM